jgi:hypothetical protein
MLALNGLQQVVNGVSPDNASVYDEGNPLTEPLSFLNVMCGQKNCRPGMVKAGDDLPYLAGAGDVNPRGWLVEKQDRRLMNDTGGEGEFALHPPGIASELTVGGISKTEGIQKLACPRPALVPPYSIQCRTEAEILEAGQLGIEVALIGNDTYQVLGSLGITGTVYPSNFNRTVIQPGQSREHINRRSLTGAVGTEKAKQFALANLETDIVDGKDFAVTLG